MPVRSDRPKADLAMDLLSPDARDVWYLASGAAFLALTILPAFRALSFVGAPPLFVLGGALLALLPVAPAWIDPHGAGWEASVVEHASELIVIVSLAGAGLAIDRAASWRCWQVAWRLLAIAMPLTILGIAMGGLWLGLPLASAVLLAASLAPTDPVLASSVQVGRPMEGEEDEVRLGLTAEAGLNDGLAFPFVYLAIGLAAASTGIVPAGDAAGIVDALGAVALPWLGWDVAYRIAAALVVGAGAGWALAWIVFRIGDASQAARESAPERGENAGLTILAATFLAYGSAELVSGYGFLAVFVAARMGRRFTRGDEELSRYNRLPHAASTQFESILLALLMVWFGGALATGLLEGARPVEWTFAAAIVLVLRPAAGYLSLLGHRLAPIERFAIAFHGIRGLGTVFYVAYAANHAAFGQLDAVWRVAAMTILVSVLVHGLTAAAIMPRIGRNGTDGPR